MKLIVDLLLLLTEATVLLHLKANQLSYKEVGQSITLPLTAWTFSSVINTRIYISKRKSSFPIHSSYNQLEACKAWDFVGAKSAPKGKYLYGSQQVGRGITEAGHHVWLFCQGRGMNCRSSDHRQRLSPLCHSLPPINDTIDAWTPTMEANVSDDKDGLVSHADRLRLAPPG